MQPDLLNQQLKLPKGVKGAETTRPCWVSQKEGGSFHVRRADALVALDTVDWFDGSIGILRHKQAQHVTVCAVQAVPIGNISLGSDSSHSGPQRKHTGPGGELFNTGHLHWTSKLDSQGSVKEAALQHVRYGWSRASRAWQRARSCWAQPCKWFGGHSHPIVCFIFSFEPGKQGCCRWDGNSGRTRGSA